MQQVHPQTYMYWYIKLNYIMKTKTKKKTLVKLGFNIVHKMYTDK